MRTLAAGLALALLACGSEAPLPPRRDGPPNIVMILSDDHGYDDYGFMGSELAETPNIDALARGGSVFPVTYNTASICRPSQISLLTGLDPIQWENAVAQLARQGPEHRGLDRVRQFMTLPRALGMRGYARLQAGKLWEGSYEMAGFSDGQKTRVAVGVHQLPAWSGGARSHAVGRTTLEPVFDFIDRHREERFYVWFAPMLPHVPFDAPERYARRFADRGLPADARGYYANVARLDDVVGELVAHLEKRGIRQDTLIVFLADNGWEVEPAERELHDGWVGGVRGKASMYELGWRTPMIFNWPGAIPAGASHPTLASSLDLFQTLLDYAETAPLPGRPGLSLRPVIEGGDPQLRRALIGSDGGVRPRQGVPDAEEPGARPPAFGLRDARWHYIWNTESGEQELYDLSVDPGETRNLADAQPERVRAFRAQIEAWRERMSEPIDPLPLPVPLRAGDGPPADDASAPS